jgi:scyllo-inositol 2-dehydrogenase (NADP+)
MAWQGFGPWGGWRGKAAMGGGRFYDLGAHLIDQMCLLFPQPIETVYCRMHHDYDPARSDTESEALVIITFADGRTGVCDLSGMTAISKPRFYAKGDRATFQKFGLDPQENAMKAGDIDSAIEDPANYGRLKGPDGERTAPTLPGRWRNFYENIADVLARGAAPAVTLSSVRRQISVMDAALRSAQTGQVVRLEQK